MKMCTFVITYADGKTVEYKHIKSASWSGGGVTSDVAENELLTRRIPTTSPIWLRGEGRNVCVSHDGIRSIDIVEEKE